MWLISLFFAAAHAAFPSYPNDFVAELSWHNTRAAQAAIVYFADEILRDGPWSVMNKSVAPPSGNKHYRPYYWPNCTGVGNTTELSQDQSTCMSPLPISPPVFVTCPYERRDGQFNPDYRLANDSGATQALMDALLYAPLAHLIVARDPSLDPANRGPHWYSDQALRAAQIFFVDDATRVTPHLNYSQLLRGPGTQLGSPTGVLDMHWWPKALAGILLMRQAAVWSDADLAGIIAWARSYIPWLINSDLAKAERASDNNHGSYYFNQLAALQILVGDNDAAKATLHDYFTGIYMQQISANGDQPKESARTHPYHYRGYNLCAMITNARLAEYVGYDGWNAKAASGAGIQAAADYAMRFTPGPGEAASELFPQIAAVAVKFGDPDGKYAAFLASKDKSYPGRPWFFWNQPLSDSGLVVQSTPDDNDPASDPDDPASQSGSAQRASVSVGVMVAALALGALF